MPNPRLLLPAAVGSDGRIYALGGNSGAEDSGTVGAPSNSVQVYDPTTDTWSVAAPMLCHQQPDRGQPLARHQDLRDRRVPTLGRKAILRHAVEPPHAHEDHKNTPPAPPPPTWRQARP